MSFNTSNYCCFLHEFLPLYTLVEITSPGMMTGSESIPCFILYLNFSTPDWFWCTCVFCRVWCSRVKVLDIYDIHGPWGCYSCFKAVKILLLLFGYGDGFFMKYSYILLRIVVVCDDDLCVWMRAAWHPSLSKCTLMSSWNWRFIEKCLCSIKRNGKTRSISDSSLCLTDFINNPTSVKWDKK